jgi:hypothetical protein
MTYIPPAIHTPIQGASKKKEKENKGQKNNPKKQPTDFPSFFFFFLRPLASAVGRLWTCHRMWAPAAGCGVFLYELVPSEAPLLWCIYETFFFADFFFSNGHFFSSDFRAIN